MRKLKSALLWALASLGLTSSVCIASGPPAGNYVVNISTSPTQSLQQVKLKTIYWADGSTQTTATSGGGSGILPLPAGATNYIQVSSSLQSGSTFYVSSATVAGPFVVNNPFSTQVRVNNTQIGGALTSGVEFAISGSHLGVLEQNNSSSLCSDLSTTCMVQPMTYSNSAGSTPFAIDQNGRTSIGGASGSVNKLTVVGNAIIGTDYQSSIVNAPTNGLRTEGSLIVDSSATISGSGLTVVSTATVGALTISGSGYPTFVPPDGNTYNLVGSSTAVTVGHFAIFSSTNGDVIDGGTGGGGGGTPGGSSGQIQYNSGGSFAGIPSFVTTSSITISTTTAFTNVGAFTMTNVSSMTVITSTASVYEVTFSTSANNYQVYISSDGGVGFMPHTKSWFGTNAALFVGETMFCSDCTTDGNVISTGTAVAQWGRISSKATGIQ